jgi:putative ABC transport system permease protein
MASGASVESARTELQPLMAAWKAAYPKVHTGHYLFVRPLLEDVAGSIRPALLMLLGATGAVLLIVCANLATVIMARGEARSREMSIRGALGARKGRLVRLSLIESALLAILGGLLGVLIAQAGVHALLAIDPSSIPRSSEVTADGRMLGFAAALSVVSAFLFGLLPALRGSSPELVSALKESNTTIGGGGRNWARRTLVAIEVALSVVLVVGAGLMLRSFERLLSVNPGFDSRGMLMASVSLPAATYGEAERVEAFYDQLLTRMRAVPGVRAASAASGVPLWSDAGVWDFVIEGQRPPGRGEVAWNAGVTIVRDQFFETLGMSIVHGRLFAATDTAGSMPVAIINETMARRFFPGVDPVGRRIRLSGDDTAWMTIVGLVSDIRDQSLDDPPRPMYYLVQSQMPVTSRGPYSNMTLIVRSSITPEALTPAIRGIIRQLDPALPIYDAQSLDTVRALSVARPRFTTTLLTVFALVGIMLGATGIYGVLSYSVARRTHEIGIRRALGATAGALFRDVIGRGMQPVMAGLVLGLVASYWTMRVIKNQLFDVSTADLATYSLVAGGILVVSLVACAVPAWRALRVNPIVALRLQ